MRERRGHDGLRIALPKGRLLLEVLDVLYEAEVDFEFTSDRDYRPQCSQSGWEAKLVKARAVPQLIALGLFDVGFVGLDLIREADYDEVVPLLDLGLNPTRLLVAAPAEHVGLVTDPPQRPLLIASEYVNLANRWALAHDLAHVTVQTWGSAEAYAPEDADVVIDGVESPESLAASGLVVLEELLASSTYLVASKDALDDPARRAIIGALVGRLSDCVASR